jgi:hypothetical protein
VRYFARQDGEQGGGDGALADQFAQQEAQRVTHPSHETREAMPIVSMGQRPLHSQVDVILERGIVPAGWNRP